VLNASSAALALVVQDAFMGVTNNDRQAQAIAEYEMIAISRAWLKKIEKGKLRGMLTIQCMGGCRA
jgi:hypothetical protein